MLSAVWPYLVLIALVLALAGWYIEWLMRAVAERECERALEQRDHALSILESYEAALDEQTRSALARRLENGTVLRRVK